MCILTWVIMTWGYANTFVNTSSFKVLITYWGSHVITTWKRNYDLITVPHMTLILFHGKQSLDMTMVLIYVLWKSHTHSHIRVRTSAIFALNEKLITLELKTLKCLNFLIMWNRQISVVVHDYLCVYLNLLISPVPPLKITYLSNRQDLDTAILVLFPTELYRKLFNQIILLST